MVSEDHNWQFTGKANDVAQPMLIPRGKVTGADGPIMCHRFKREGWHLSQTAFYKTCRRIGFPEIQDLNHPDVAGDGPIPCNNANGMRMSSALGYLSEARHRRNLTIRAKCMAQRPDIDGRGAVNSRSSTKPTRSSSTAAPSPTRHSRGQKS